MKKRLTYILILISSASTYAQTTFTSTANTTINDLTIMDDNGKGTTAVDGNLFLNEHTLARKISISQEE